MEVAEGDEIVFSKYGRTEIKVGSDECLILRESDVLAKVAGGKKSSRQEEGDGGRKRLTHRTHGETEWHTRG